MKTIWTGSISFGLVTIPIKIYSAIDHKKFSFRLLDEKDKSPIKYKRVSSKTGREVPWNEIVKGIEVSKNEFKIFKKEELERLKPEKTDTIDIVEFVDAQQIDPIYFDSHYYIAPEKKKEKAYFLFKHVLQSTGKAAIGRFVMREKEYTCIVSSYKKGILLTTLNCQYEIRDIDQIEELKEKPKLSEQEIKLAKNLINQLYQNEFQISKFKDTFEEQLKDLLTQKQKVKTKKTKTKSKEKENLIKSLKASLK